MARPKRNILAAAAVTSTPPDVLSEGQCLARVIKATGNNVFLVEQPSGKELTVELPSHFRSVIWIKRGSFVLVDMLAFAERDNKLDGEIVNIVREERAWRKMSFWPSEFSTKPQSSHSDSEDNTRVGEMPPSDPEDDS